MSLEINTMTRPGDLVSYVSDPGSYYPIEADKNCNLVGMTPAEIYRVCKYVSDIVRPMIGESFLVCPERFRTATVLELDSGDITKAIHQYLKNWFPNEIQNVSFKVKKIRKPRKGFVFSFSHAEVKMSVHGGS